ncbi:MAG: response regulator transcription factor [Candidatus Dormiibacterota bacterium]
MNTPSATTAMEREAGVFEVAPEGAHRARTTVLIVDDYPAMLRAIPDALSTDDTLTVVGSASRIADAVIMARELQPGVAVIDVNMPGGSGWALARRLRQTVPGIRLVAYSAWADDAAIHRTPAGEGANAFVLKGSDIELLLAAVHGVEVMPAHQEPAPILGRVRQRQAEGDPAA